MLTSCLPVGPGAGITRDVGELIGMSLAKNAGSTPVPLISNVKWEPFGPVSGWDWHMASGLVNHTRLFDLSGRIVRYPLGNALRDVTYDAADRISGFTHLSSSDGTAQSALDQSFGYDENSRLTGITTAASSWSIAYDPNGNRTSVSLNGNPSTYTTEATSNRLTSITNPARSFAYDNAGNTTSDSANYTATYALNGSIASITKAGVTGSYDYDAERRRIRKVTNTGETVIFVYDLEGQLLGEYDQTGKALREYVWLDNIPVAMFMPDPANASNPNAAPLVFYIHADHLNAPRIVVDQNGAKRWRWIAEPFGTTAPEANPEGLGSFTQNLRFPGQYADAESGLWYNYFRYYDSLRGGYPQSDPIGLAGGINTYGYVSSMPISYIDPNGLAQIFGRPESFEGGVAWAKKYKDLLEANNWMRAKIIQICKGDGGAMLRRFDQWRIYIDPNIDDPLRRAKENYATTKYGSQSSIFGKLYFDPPSSGFPGTHMTFAHEFRHLMPANNQLVNPYGGGSAFSDNAYSAKIEKDADWWANKFMDGVCVCQ